ncbi:uncharacterized protein B0H18DRAFT_1004330 [Fomitopsis serialis]|uniref:uncharacterized protein n=1 Tax=Fomitopsis serialis TaxID=139415 RepID=UPI002007539C|nr:uncharacterized protein B0H18DRAFT_1004330 [Neoantrodia serialis]KAH9926885.1 hypothetical protein B0H18DRAFT_1004330 [Neoantrodia serialis]
MTWVLGWPLYDDDAIEIAKQHHLVKDPNAPEYRYIETAREWIADQVGIIPTLSCWVDSFPELVYAAYVAYGDNRYPPTKLVSKEIISRKQHRRLGRAMPLRDFGWYQYDDPSGVLYEKTRHESDEDSDEDNDEDSDEGSDEGDDEDGDRDVSMNNTSDEEDREEDSVESDNETVTDGAVSKLDFLPEDSGSFEAAKSLPKDFGECVAHSLRSSILTAGYCVDACCTIAEPQP